MYTQIFFLYGAIWAKYPNVAYLEGRLKSNKYGNCYSVSTVVNVVCIVQATCTMNTKCELDFHPRASPSGNT